MSFSFRRIWTRESPEKEKDRRTSDRIESREGSSILIVDDAATVVFILRKMLSQAGFTVYGANNAEEGIVTARKKRPSLVFMDVVLPGMNGFQATRILRKFPETCDIPIVVMSGNQQATEQFWVKKIGANDFMTKPFTRADVFKRIRLLLDVARAS